MRVVGESEGGGGGRLLSLRVPWAGKRRVEHRQASEV
jgi:hypothetical protein